MGNERECPFCHRQHEVADDGTIPTWIVAWAGDEVIKARRKHYLSDARALRLALLRKKYGKREPEEECKEGIITNRASSFIHYEDAVNEYNWLKSFLVKRGDWDVQQEFLTLTTGERASWAELFEEPGIYNWEA